MFKCCQKITTSTLCTVPYQLLLARNSTRRKCTIRDNIDTVFLKRRKPGKRLAIQAQKWHHINEGGIPWVKLGLRNTLSQGNMVTYKWTDHRPYQVYCDVSSESIDQSIFTSTHAFYISISIFLFAPFDELYLIRLTHCIDSVPRFSTVKSATLVVLGIMESDMPVFPQLTFKITLGNGDQREVSVVWPCSLY